ncbi:hypothetical protein BPO_p0070 (plasmid) [Bergeyella porcorum]|uniref:KTSC domain-containing protein n=1 Tax=Bergeyella porcorum TaxID=1735111 RepID=A0AAU0F6W4_9FLAO
MKNVEILHIKKWDYCLYNVNGRKVITVVFFNSFSDYERSFYLNPEEVNMNYEELSIFAEKIRFNYVDYADREVIPPIT